MLLTHSPSVVVRRRQSRRPTVSRRGGGGVKLSRAPPSSNSRGERWWWWSCRGRNRVRTPHGVAGFFRIRFETVEKKQIVDNNGGRPSSFLCVPRRLFPARRNRVTPSCSRRLCREPVRVGRIAFSRLLGRARRSSKILRIFFSFSFFRLFFAREQCEVPPSVRYGSSSSPRCSGGGVMPLLPSLYGFFSDSLRVPLSHE